MGFDDFDVWEIGLKGGEVGIALVGVVDVADQPFINAVAESAVNFRSADDEDFLIRDRDLGGAVDDIDALVFPIAIAGEDDVATLGEGSANRFEGFSAHHDGVAEGGFFEKREILGKMPRQGAIATDEAIRIHGDDGDEHSRLR